MKKYILLSFVLSFCLPCLSQTTVSSYSKISLEYGNLGAQLGVGDQFGVSSDSLGDLNNDGINDIVVGANLDDDGGSNTGAIYILFLNDDGTVQSEQKISSTEGGFTGELNNGDVFGTAVACIGDLNNDGVNDIAVGAEYDGDGGYWSGAVWILFLNSNGTVQSHFKINESDLGVNISGSPTFGSAIANVGDVNGDGIVDLAIGSRRDDDGGTRMGAVWILFLAVDGSVQSYQKISHTNGSLGYSLSYEDYFGCEVKNIGDLNEDGVNEIVVGAYKDDDGASNNGAFYIIFLNSDGTVLNSKKISSTEGGFDGVLSDGAYFGLSLSPAGDLDGDCIMDLFVGAAKQETINGDSGSAFIIYLNSDGTVKAHQEISPGVNGFNTNLSNGDLFGRSIAFIGELAGTKTLLVGASKDDDGAEDSGAIWMLKLKGTLDAPCSEDHISILEIDNLDISFYPNPVDDIITFINLSAETDLTIYNVFGQNLITTKINNNSTINLSYFKPGIYYVSVNGTKQVLVVL